MEEKNKSNKGLIVTIIVLLVALTGIGTYILCDKVLIKDKETGQVNNTINNNQTVNNTTNNNTTENSSVNLNVENCLNCGDGITYSRARKSVGDIGVSLSINNDKKAAKATIDFNKLDGTSGIKNYEVNGFNKNIKDVFVGANGQDKTGTYLLFIMEDKTVEYTPLYKMINNKHELNLTDGAFKSAGSVDDLTNISEFYIVDGCNTSCWIETLAFTQDGKYYRLHLK